MFLLQGCGRVDGDAAFINRGQRFESSHRQLLLNIYLLLTVHRKDKKYTTKRPKLFFPKHFFFSQMMAHLFDEKN